MSATVLQCLQAYRRPADFADWAPIDRRQYAVAYAQHRDSDTITRSNFRVILRAIGGEAADDHGDRVVVLRDRHWAVGWTEAIYVRLDAIAELETADRIVAGLEAYAIADEEDWSALEYDDAIAYWQGLSLSERVRYCTEYGASIFAARRTDAIPEDANGELIGVLAR